MSDKRERLFTIKLKDCELKPKSPIRERQVTFEDLMVRNTELIIDQNEKLTEQNKKLFEEINFLKSKVENLEEKTVKKIDDLIDDTSFLANKFVERNNSINEKLLKTEKLQKELSKNQSCSIQ
jgi:uncharacterized protein with von Willebrand factor type A (vWA) domain